MHLRPCDGVPPQMAAQLIPKRTSRCSTSSKKRAQAVCPRQISRVRCRRLRVILFFLPKKKRETRGLTWIYCVPTSAPILFGGVPVLILGCWRWGEGRSGTADNVRGACPWIRRTYHVCMRPRSTYRSLPIHPLLCDVLTRERESLTDNGNRTLHQLREILNDHK